MTIRQKLFYLRGGPFSRTFALLRAAFLRRLLRSDGDARHMFDEYHHWFYGSGVLFRLTWEGIPAIKSPLDMWNYQQLIWSLQPSLIIEFGTNCGGSAVYFSRILTAMGGNRRVFTVDVEERQVDPKLVNIENIIFHRASTTDSSVIEAIERLRHEFPGPVFVILDSDHSMTHVLSELRVITPLLRQGDRLVVEDTNINGHPVLAGWGPGPFEAVEAFLLENPTAYARDDASAKLFGWTCAPEGFLIRN